MTPWHAQRHNCPTQQVIFKHPKYAYSPIIPQVIIENICSIVNSRLSLLRKIKPFLNYHCALRFFNSCIHNLFIYCSSAWGNCFNYLLSRLLLLQERPARLLLDADYSQPSVSLFSKFKWLPIFDRIKLRKFVLLSTILNNPDAPLCLQRKFNFLFSVRSTGLRTRACVFNLQVPYARSNSGKRTFAGSCLLWVMSTERYRSI